MVTVRNDHAIPFYLVESSTIIILYDQGVMIKKHIKDKQTIKSNTIS